MSFPCPKCKFGVREGLICNTCGYDLASKCQSCGNEDTKLTHGVELTTYALHYHCKEFKAYTCSCGAHWSHCQKGVD